MARCSDHRADQIPDSNVGAQGTGYPHRLGDVARCSSPRTAAACLPLAWAMRHERAGAGVWGVATLQRGASINQNPPAAATRFWWLLLLVLLVGALVRLPFVPRLGHAYDADLYREWMGAVQDHGIGRVFVTTDTDYVGYHYLLWLLGVAYGKPASETTVRDKPLRVWLKVPGLLGDLLATLVVGTIARGLASERRWRAPTRLARVGSWLHLPDAELAGVVVAALVMLHPAVLYASSYWGQSDSLVGASMLAACWLVWRERPGWAGTVLALGVMVKPQPLVVGPLLAVLMWRRCGWTGLLRGGVAGAAVLGVGHLYFILTGNTQRMLEIYTIQITQNEHLSFAAYNLWWPFERMLQARPADAIIHIGGGALTYGAVASFMVLAILALALRRLWHADDHTMLTTIGVFLAGYFLVASASHERYALPALLFLLPATLLTPRLRWPLLLYSFSVTANLLIALPLDRRWRAGDPVWLTVVISISMTLTVAWLTVMTRKRDDGVSAAE